MLWVREVSPATQPPIMCWDQLPVGGLHHLQMGGLNLAQESQDGLSLRSLP
jgi:hypothetical protein